MKKALITFAVLVLVVFAVPTFAKGLKSHGKQSVGTVSKLDEAGKTFVLMSNGKENTISWTEATKVTGGSLKDGETAVVRWMKKDGKMVATSIRIRGAKAAAKSKKAA